jgi:hypothetical protein
MMRGLFGLNEFWPILAQFSVPVLMIAIMGLSFGLDGNPKTGSWRNIIVASLHCLTVTASHPAAVFAIYTIAI